MEHERLTARLSPMTISDDLDRRITVYWHAKLLPSKAAAIRELLSLALDWAVEHPEPPAKGKRQ